MTVWNIYDKNGTHVNTVCGTKENIDILCQMEGYTCELSHEENEDDKIVKDETVNNYLSAQIKAVDDRVDFIEDCIAEIATEVYKEE